MLIEAETLPEVQAARNSALLAHHAWEVTVTQLGVQDAIHASFVTISSTEDTPTELSMKRKREADLAEAEASALATTTTDLGRKGSCGLTNFRTPNP